MYFFLFTGRSAFNWGACKWGGDFYPGGGGLVTGCMFFLFTGRWAYNWWGRVISGGGGAYIRGGL